jgi:hypothetical protein
LYADRTILNKKDNYSGSGKIFTLVKNKLNLRGTKPLAV